MNEAISTIFELLIAGGILSAIISFLHDYLSSRRQFRQALEQKMIDRVSHLVEHYYEQISCSSENLRNALLQALHTTSSEEIAAQHLYQKARP